MNQLINRTFWTFAFLILAMPQAHASIAERMFDADPDFVMDKEKFSGSWTQSDSWKGNLCRGKYSYTTFINGKVDELKFELTDKGYIDAYADLHSIRAGISGFYKSGYTLCVPVGGYYSATANRFEAKARIWIDEKDGKIDVKVRIYESKLHRVYFSDYLPNWLEKFLTKKLNQAMNYVWTTTLGEWIGEKAAEYLEENFDDFGG